MNYLAILDIVAKGLVVVGNLVEEGKKAAPAINALKDLVTGARKGEVSQEAMDNTSALLDSMLAEFNIDLPPAQPGDPDYTKPA